MPRTSSSRFVRSLETQPACGFLEAPAHALHKVPALPPERKLAEAASPFPLDEPVRGLRAGPSLPPCRSPWQTLALDPLSPEPPAAAGVTGHGPSSQPAQIPVLDDLGHSPQSPCRFGGFVSSHGRASHDRRQVLGQCGLLTPEGRPRAPGSVSWKDSAGRGLVFPLWSGFLRGDLGPALAPLGLSLIGGWQDPEWGLGRNQGRDTKKNVLKFSPEVQTWGSPSCSQLPSPGLSTHPSSLSAPRCMARSRGWTVQSCPGG